MLNPTNAMFEIKPIKIIEMPFLVGVKNGEPVFENKTIQVIDKPAKETTK